MESRLKILVVDPDKSERDLLQTTLGEMGLDPVCLADGREAAERIKVEKFDGIFLDWNLPGLTGKRLIRRIRNSPSNSKVPLGVMAEKSSRAMWPKRVSKGWPSCLPSPSTRRDCVSCWKPASRRWRRSSGATAGLP